MTRFVDANVLLRYLTNDVPSLAERAAGIIDSRETITITPVVLAETAYTLVSFYRQPRER